MSLKRAIFPVVLLVALALPAAAQAELTFLPGATSVTARNADGTIDTSASSHPDSLEVSLGFQTDSNGYTTGGDVRDIVVELPPGLIGNPRAIPTCSRAQFEGPTPSCPGSTQVGILRVLAPVFGETFVPVYNLTPPPGVATQFAAAVFNFVPFQYSSVLPDDGYRIAVANPNVPLALTSASETIWGTPSDPSHDDERVCGSIIGCSALGQKPPFLTMPAACGEAITTIKAAAKGEDTYVSEDVPLRDAAGDPAPIAGCGDAVPFSPQFSFAPSSRAATSPSGLDFELKLPNQGLLGKGAIAETEPRKAVVTLPEGMSVNPSFAEGTGVCSEEQYEAEQLDTKAGQGCPESSKLGSIHALSPLLEEPIEGSLYLAAPYENPFDSLAALYMVGRAPERGILVKQAGKIEFDQSTGQITTSFDHLPPLPFSSFTLHFREGARAPLATPRACGEYTTTGRFTPHSATDDTEAIEVKAAFQIERGPEGGSCPSGGLPPFHPGLLAGAENSAAGAFTPFYVGISRKDAEQEITHFSIKLPPGITGKLAGVPYCSDQAIEAAKARTGPHGGQEELDSPSCPAASQVGTSLAGSGVGSALAYVPGKVYLAGPYNGSNLSIVAITAAKAGPFDLGTVVVREALRIDPETAEVFIDATGSDPIPHIIRGVPVNLRDIRAYVNRPEFVLNPTDCTPTSTASTVLGAGLDFVSEADDNPLTVTSPFQAADCAALPFKPRLGLKLIGGSKRGSHPAFKAHLEMNGIGEAGIASTEVILPRSEFIENKHIRTVCTRVQFKAGGGNGEQCPPGSVYGKARAVTPLLSEPLEGPVFLRSNGNERSLPDLVVALHSSQVDFDLVGFIDSVKGGGIRNTFASAPDAPVSSFDLEMAGGKKGLLVNSQDLCAKTRRAQATFTGQNGKVFEAKPALRAKCKGKARHKRRG